MITDRRQYQVTKAQAERFERALEGLVEQDTADPTQRRLLQARRAGLQSLLQDLRQQIADYESL